MGFAYGRSAIELYVLRPMLDCYRNVYVGHGTVHELLFVNDFGYT